MNVADTDRMELLLFHSGYIRTGEMQDADLVLINTCSIRDKAEQKIYSLTGSLKPLKEAKLNEELTNKEYCAKKTCTQFGGCPTPCDCPEGNTEENPGMCKYNGNKPDGPYKKHKKLKEAEVTAGESNTNFNLKVDVSNKQSETKLGIRIQLEPKEGFLEPDLKDKLEIAVSKKLNNALEQFDMQVSKDTDVPDPTVIGFFIPLSQIKNMIVKSLKKLVH